jgi:sugar lactone lactonase YvrE
MRWLKALILLSLFACSQATENLNVHTLVNGQALKLEKVSALAEIPRKGWQPDGLVVTQTGLIFFTDRENHRVMRLTPTGVLQVLAGNGEAGEVDGQGEAARFDHPTGLSLAANGELYLADTGNQRVRKLTQEGEVSTVQLSRQVDFLAPEALLIGQDQTLYISDGPSGRLFSLQDSVKKIMQTAPSLVPEALALTPSGQLIFADLQGIWLIESSGERSLLRANDSELRRVRGLTTDGNKGYYLSDAYLHRVLYWRPGAALEVLAGGPDAGDQDGDGHKARFSFPGALARGPAGELYLADSRNNRICKLQRDSKGHIQVSTLARSGSQGFGERRDGEDLSLPHGVLYDARQNLYIVSDYLHHRLLKISPDGVATPWLEPKQIEGEPIVLPAGLAQAADGTVFVSGSGRHRIHKITPDGKVTVLAGSGKVGFNDGKGSEASFYLPFGLAVGPDNTVYVADQGNHAIRKISPDGRVTTLAGNGSADWRDGLGRAARFNKPSGIAMHPDGSIWVADSWNHRLRRISPQGQVSTVLGDKVPGQVGFDPDRDFEQSLYVPEGLAINAEGEVFIADSWNHRIRKWEPASKRFITLAGNGRYLNFGAGFADARGYDARFSQPKGVALGPNGSLIVADTGNNRIRILEP